MSKRSPLRRLLRIGLLTFVACFALGALIAVLLVLPYYIVLALSHRVSDPGVTSNSDRTG